MGLCFTNCVIIVSVGDVTQLGMLVVLVTRFVL